MPSGEPLEVIDPDAYYKLRGLDGKGLRVPADLDEAICAYQKLGREHRERFDRALFWMDLASEQWTTSMSSSPLRMERNPARTREWSSATSTLMSPITIGFHPVGSGPAPATRHR